MIFDSLENIGEYVDFSESFYEGLLFLKDLQKQTNDGFYRLSSSVSATISEYRTKSQNQAFFESHSNHIDIHSVLSGSEKILVENVCKLHVLGNYDSEKDCWLYEADSCRKASSILLTPGVFLVLFSDEGHSPGIRRIDSVSEKVKKVVVKVSTNV
jgi:YhcH/YjgK/YiaL family protein